MTADSPDVSVHRPATHPALRYDLTNIEIVVRGGRPLDGLASLRSWSITARLPSVISQWGLEGEPTTTVPPELQEIAAMLVVAADLLVGDVAADADDHSQALSEIAAGLPALNDPDDESEFAFKVDTPLLLVEEFTVSEEWSGSALTPAMAILMLWPVVALGARRVALKAHPMLHGSGRGDIGDDEAAMRRVAGHIGRMWRLVGLVETGPADVLYGVVDTALLRRALMDLIAAHPELAELGDVL